MVKVQYVGSRACKADNVLWAKYDIKDVAENFYEKYKNQGFILVENEKPAKKVEKKQPVFIEDDDVEETKKDEKDSNKFEEIEE